MDLFLASALILITLLNSAIAVLVYRKAKSSFRRNSFILSHFFGAVWTLGALVTAFSQNESIARVSYNLFEIAPVFAIFFVLSYFISYLSKYSKLLLGSLFVTTILVSIHAVLNKGYEYLSISKFSVNTLEASGNYVYDVYFFGILVIIAAIIRVAIQQEQSTVARKRLKYTALGGLITVSMAILFNIVLINSNVSSAIWTGPIFTPFFNIAATFAILKYNLLDIPEIVGRAITYKLFLLTVVASYFMMLIFIAYTVQARQDNTLLIAGIVSGLTVSILIFSRLLHVINKTTNTVFFRGNYNFEKSITHLSHSLSSVQLDDEAIRVFKEILTQTIQPSFINVSAKAQEPDYEHHLSFILEAPRGNKFIVLGPKSNGEKYSEKDSLFFQNSSLLLQLTISNLGKLSEIQTLNKSLNKRVKSATKDLAAANIELRNLDEAKDTFIELAAHQLKSPVMATEQSVSLLKDATDDERSRLLELATESSGRTQELIEEMLSITKATLGKLDIQPKKTDLDQLIHKRIYAAATTATQKQIKINYEVSGKKSTTLLDAKYIREVVSNFLDNAIKYSPEASTVNVQLSFNPSDLQFSVSDKGIGVPKKDQSKIFNKFYRANNAQKVDEGTGLGLFLAKEVIDKHGGEIIFESKPSHGSTFGFKLPLQ